MTDPAYDVWWHLESSEGHQWIVGRIPGCENQATQAESFEDLKLAVQEVVALSTGVEAEDVTVGDFHEESEADFIEAISGD